MERKLVTVRRITHIKPIYGADLIEQATVDGWKCVVMKGEFQPGDLCVYFEIDSFILAGPAHYEFLMQNDKISWQGLEGARIRTREFRKQVSQGLAMPLFHFPQIQHIAAELDEASLRAYDFTEFAGVVKWEAIVPDELADQVIGGMPSFLPETGGDRIQNLPDLLAESPDEEFEESIKLDGFSMSVFNHLHQSGVCGRSWWFKPEVENEYTRTAERQGLLQALKKHPRSLGLQGELIGPGVMKNKEKLEEKEFRLFRIWDIAESRRLSPQERDQVIQELRDLGADIKTTLFTGIFKLRDLGTMEDLLARADGPSLNPQTKREGLFYHSVTGRGSFKVISNRYLLKNRDS